MFNEKSADIIRNTKVVIIARFRQEMRYKVLPVNWTDENGNGKEINKQYGQKSFD